MRNTLEDLKVIWWNYPSESKLWRELWNWFEASNWIWNFQINNNVFVVHLPWCRLKTLIGLCSTSKFKETKSLVWSEECIKHLLAASETEHDIFQQHAQSIYKISSAVHWKDTVLVENTTYQFLNYFKGNLYYNSN